MSTIQTPRLKVRLLEKRDAVKLCEAVIETMDQLLPWMSWAESYKMGGVSVAKKFIKKTNLEARRGDGWHFGIWNHDRFIGVAALMKFDRFNREVEVGYWCRTSEQKKGFITEAINALTRFALEHLLVQRVVLICRDENVKSAAVAERLQFKLEQIGPYEGDLLPGAQYRFYCCSCCNDLPELAVVL